MNKILIWITLIGGYLLIGFCALVGAWMVLFETTLLLKIIGLIVVYCTSFILSITIHELLMWRKNNK